MESEAADDTVAKRDLPGFGITLLTILLPLLIMVTRTVLLIFIGAGGAFNAVLTAIGVAPALADTLLVDLVL